MSLPVPWPHREKLLQLGHCWLAQRLQEIADALSNLDGRRRNFQGCFQGACGASPIRARLSLANARF